MDYGNYCFECKIFCFCFKDYLAYKHGFQKIVNVSSYKFIIYSLSRVSFKVNPIIPTGDGAGGHYHFFNKTSKVLVLGCKLDFYNCFSCLFVSKQFIAFIKVNNKFFHHFLVFLNIDFYFFDILNGRYRNQNKINTVLCNNVQ